jgi:glycolate oxidase FAD binding subunit
MSDLALPRDRRDLSEIIAHAAATKTRLEILGDHTKARLGRPMKTDRQLSTRQMSGVTFYSPKELVIAARAGTTLSMIEHTLRHENQMLAFEPIDFGPAFGMRAGLGTIGGVFATNLSGPRRLRAGSARDALIGFDAVNGRGEPFMSGGRVTKNVAGYDLSKGLAGSWGTLCVYHEVTMKVVPRPEAVNTLFLTGLEDTLAINALCDAMRSPYEVTAAAHLQAAPASHLSNPSLASLGKSITAIRLENMATAVSIRGARLRAQLSPYGEVGILGDEQSHSFWQDLRLLRFLADNRSPLWRVSTAPKNGPRLVAELSRIFPVSAVYDWSGGLVWLEVPDSTDVSASDIRRSLAHLGGHATLIRARDDARIRNEVFQPIPGALGRLTRGLKDSFDPQHILNPERMYAGL